MHILSDILKPFAKLLSNDLVSKTDFVKIAHEKGFTPSKNIIRTFRDAAVFICTQEGEELVLE